MSNLNNTDYSKFFPENLKKYKNLRILSKQFEDIFKEKIVTRIDALAIFKNLESQSDEVLSELAWQYVIDNWQESLDREVKIRLIKNAYWAHSKKGTKSLIIENLKKLNYPITVQEWFEYGGKPFTFKVIANHINSSPDWIDILVDIIEKYKNCRSIVETVDLELNREIREIKMGNFVSCEIEKEFIGLHYDIDKKSNISKGIFRITEMEVEKCLKD